MLDFGTEMNSQRDPEREDDLFSSAPETVNNSNAPAAPAEASAEVSAPAQPKRPWIKPPTLPKYTEQTVQKVEKVHPALKRNPHFLHRKRKAEDFSAEDKTKVSRILKAARNSAGLTPQDVETATQIRAHYLIALEEADYNHLPQPVYVLAYLRKLCELYHIPAEEEEELVKPWRNIPYELPDAEKLEGLVQTDPENTNNQTLIRLKLIILAAGTIIVIGLLILIIVLVVSHINSKLLPQSTFDNKRLLEIQPKPELIIPAQPKAQ